MVDTNPIPAKDRQRAALHRLRTKLAARGLYPVHVTVVRPATGAMTRIAADAAHPAPLPPTTEVHVNLLGQRVRAEVTPDPEVSVRLRVPTLWGSEQLKGGSVVRVPASQVTWLD